MKNTLSRLNLRRQAGVNLLLATLSVSSLAQAAPLADLSPQQQDQIGKAAENYLLAHPEKMGEAIASYLAEHPEFLVAAGESLRQRQAVSQRQALQQRALQKASELLNQDSPFVGPKDAKVAVVMFFDYQCLYCSKMAPIVTPLIKANPDVRFIFKEFPIFAPRWPASGLAARIGDAVWREKGAKAYLTYHDALFSTGKVEGALTTVDIRNIAKSYLSATQLDTLEKANDNSPSTQAIMQNLTLAQQLQLMGTPAFFVLPQDTAQGNLGTLTVFPGSTTEESLQQAINRANTK